MLALRQNGELWGWGHNVEGQITGAMHDATRTIRAPRKILQDVTQIAASAYHSFAVKRDGSLWGWGLNWYGMGLKLKNPRAEFMKKEYAISFSRILPPTVVQIAAAGGHSLALVKNSRAQSPDSPDAHILMAWGYNTCNELGDDEWVDDQATPLAVRIAVLKGKRIRKIAAAGAYSLALTEDGEVWKWGEFGGFKPCTGIWPEHLEVAAKIAELSDIVDIAAGRWAVWALKKDGTLWGWGLTGRMIGGGWGTYLINILPDVREIAAGDKHVLALKNDGTVWAWGTNEYGELGDGAKNPHEGPVRVIIPSLYKADTSHLVR
jgi:alpha-tubulin suppressor-like RCC1 family protein